MKRVFRVAKFLVVLFLCRPFVWFFLGVSHTQRFHLRTRGPVIIAANHNSHLDAVMISALVSLKDAYRIRFVSAADYFGTNAISSWVFYTLFEMIPVVRTKFVKRKRAGDVEPMDLICEALDQNDLIVIFPEGSRGVPEKLGRLKRGIASIAHRYKDLPIYPVYIRGLGKALPRGDFLFVPFIPEIMLGDPIIPQDMSEEQILESLNSVFSNMEASQKHSDWVEV